LHNEHIAMSNILKFKTDPSPHTRACQNGAKRPSKTHHVVSQQTVDSGPMKDIPEASAEIILFPGVYYCRIGSRVRNAKRQRDWLLLVTESERDGASV